MKKRKFVNGGGISARKKNRSIRRHVKKGKKAPVTKGQVRDVNSRRIFEDPLLSSQFLRNYSGCELFKDISPEDVEDVSKKYQAYLGIAFELPG